MALLKYLKKKEEKQLTLPTIQNGIDTSLTEKDLECANKNVSTILLSNDCVNEMRRDKYNSYMPKELTSKIGQYAARYFTGVFSRDLNESTARRLKTEYLQQLKEKRQSGKTPQFANLLSNGYSPT